jgi:hypothetical protein
LHHRHSTPERQHQNGAGLCHSPNCPIAPQVIDRPAWCSAAIAQVHQPQIEPINRLTSIACQGLIIAIFVTENSAKIDT